MTDAMEQLKANFDAEAGGASIKSHEALAEFKHLITAATFVRLDKGRKEGSFMARLKKADGILRPTKSGKREHLLFADALQEWFPDITTRNRLVKLLRSRRIFGKGRRSDTSTRQVFIAELGRKVACYALSRKRLRSVSAASKPSG
jgi:hypothetical protein